MSSNVDRRSGRLIQEFNRRAHRTLHQMRYELRESISHLPELYLPLARSSYLVKVAKRAAIVDRDTDITIEAFPGSANTYAVSAFLAAQPPEASFRIAHHSHTAAQIIASGRWGVPTLVIVREPEEAVLSFVVRNKLLTLGQVVRAYCRFHGNILSHHDHYVVTTFDQVVGDFPVVIDRINRKFGTAFASRSDADGRGAHSGVKEWHAHVHRQKDDHKIWATDVPLPSEERSRRKAALRQRFHDEVPAELLERASRLYARFAAQE